VSPSGAACRDRSGQVATLRRSGRSDSSQPRRSRRSPRGSGRFYGTEGRVGRASDLLWGCDNESKPYGMHSSSTRQFCASTIAVTFVFPCRSRGQGARPVGNADAQPRRISAYPTDRLASNVAEQPWQLVCWRLGYDARQDRCDPKTRTTPRRSEARRAITRLSGLDRARASRYARDVHGVVRAAPASQMVDAASLDCLFCSAAPRSRASATRATEQGRGVVRG